jgi:hypothetical protein
VLWILLEGINMETITFSYLENITDQELISLLKRIAKRAKSSDLSDRLLAWHQDFVAQKLGFNNWSLLHKHLSGLGDEAFELALNRVLAHEEIGPEIESLAVRTIATDDAIEEMTSWAKGKYTQLVHFAFHDKDSESGYDWPDVYMVDELNANFEHKFPFELIQQVGSALDRDEGPWGLRDFGDD